MANVPVYNGGARATVTNGGIPALEVRFCFRAKIGAAPPAGDETIANTTFEAAAGTPLTIHYDVRKNGAGLEVDTPTEGRVFAFLDNFNEDATINPQIDSGDIIAGTALPKTGSFTFTPSLSGTYRLAVWMRKVDTPATSNWSVHSDGSATFGTTSGPRSAANQDKGRLRYGRALTTLAITLAGGAPPNPFAFTTAAAEQVQVDTTYAINQSVNPSTDSLYVHRIKQRRNGTSTIDANVLPNTSLPGAEQAFITVDKRNYPALAATSYDTLVVVEALSRLHSQNSPQYNGLGGQAASGVFEYFSSVGAGLTLIDFLTAARLASHNVNTIISIENIFCKDSDYYSDVGGAPVGAEDFSYIATAQNMTVTVGRVLNARSEALSGMYVYVEIVKDGGSTRDTWGLDNPTYRTITNGWQGNTKVVVVSTPPAGIHNILAIAYYPVGESSGIGNAQARTSRYEAGSPASAATGKDWIAPAEFSSAAISVAQFPDADGVAVPFVVATFDKVAGVIAFVDADIVPLTRIYKRTASGALTLHATPTITKRAATTGLYDGSFTPTTLSAGNPDDDYVITSDVTVKSSVRRWSEPTTAQAPPPAPYNYEHGYRLTLTHTSKNGLVRVVVQPFLMDKATGILYAPTAKPGGAASITLTPAVEVYLNSDTPGAAPTLVTAYTNLGQVPGQGIDAWHNQFGVYADGNYSITVKLGIDGLMLPPSSHGFSVGGSLTLREIEILNVLVANAGQVIFTGATQKFAVAAGADEGEDVWEEALVDKDVTDEAVAEFIVPKLQPRFDEQVAIEVLDRRPPETFAPKRFYDLNNRGMDGDGEWEIVDVQPVAGEGNATMTKLTLNRRKVDILDNIAAIDNQVQKAERQ